MSAYRDKVDVIIGKMFSLRRTIRMVDQEVLTIYLTGVHTEAETLTHAFDPDPVTVPPELVRLFRERDEAVETGLRQGLETVRYIIDAPDTLSLILGSGRIEDVRCSYQRDSRLKVKKLTCSLGQKVLPLLYLLLSRDLQVFRSCQTKYVSPEELIASWHSLEIVFEEVDQRYRHLKGMHTCLNSVRFH